VTFTTGSLRCAGIKSSPDEDRLLRRLFDPEQHNLLTTPVQRITETINVTMEIEIRKLIDLVSGENLLTLNY